MPRDCGAAHTRRRGRRVTVRDNRIVTRQETASDGFWQSLQHLNRAAGYTDELGKRVRRICHLGHKCCVSASEGTHRLHAGLLMRPQSDTMPSAATVPTKDTDHENDRRKANPEEQKQQGAGEPCQPDTRRPATLAAGRTSQSAGPTGTRPAIL